jgi:hypothetical protein
MGRAVGAQRPNRARRGSIPLCLSGAGNPSHAHRASIPHIGLVIRHAVFVQERTILVLKRTDAMMFLLVVDVGRDGHQVRRSHGEAPVAALPGEVAQGGGLGLEPFGRRGLQGLDQVGDGQRARESDGEMHMIGHAADAVGFTTGVSCHLGQIGVEVRAQRGVEARKAILGTEHQMDDDEAEGLRHGGRSMGRAFSPSPGFLRHVLGRWPRLGWGAPLALNWEIGLQ